MRALGAYDCSANQMHKLQLLPIDQSGGGALPSPPQANRVEIAYYTLPEMEGQGFASSTARELVSVARRAVPEITISAQTLPTPNSSNALLQKLRFTFDRALLHPGRW